MCVIFKTQNTWWIKNSIDIIKKRQKMLKLAPHRKSQDQKYIVCVG